MPSKRVRSLVRATPTENLEEIPATTVNNFEADDYIYDSDDDPNVNASVFQRMTRSATGTTAPIATANQVTENMAPVVLGNEVTNAMAPLMVTSATNIMAPIASADQVTNTAASLRAAADIMDPAIIQMGSVVLSEQARPITDLTHQTVFNMRTAVSLTDTVNETLAAK